MAQQKYKRITLEDGLDNNIVTSIVQDNKNFMWFTTPLFGITRYDGKSFVFYPLPQDIPNNNFDFMQVLGIIKDKDGTLWTSTRRFLYRYNNNLDKFEIIIKYKTAKGKTPNAHSIYADNNNQIWIGSSYGLLRYNTQTKKLFTMNSLKETVSVINEDNSGTIWVTSKKGIIKYNATNKGYKSILKPLNIAIEPGTTYIDKNQNIWIGTLENGLYIFDTKRNTLKNVTHVNKLVKSTAIRSIVYLPKKQQYLLATDGEGLIRLAENLDIIAHEIYNPDNQSTISSNSLLHIYLDKFSRVWIATYGGGISYTSNKLPFHNFSHELNNPNSLSNNMGRCSTEDNDGKIWFGTSKGISIYNPKNKQWHSLSLVNKEQLGSNIIVLSLINTNDGYIWAGTYGNGLKKINSKTYATEHYKAGDSTNLKSSLNTNYVYSLHKDDRKNIWIGGIRGPLAVVNPNFATISTYDVRDINAIIEDNKGNIYAGGSNGLSYVNIFTNATTKISLGNKYETVVIYAMLNLPNNNIWLATSNGLLLYKPNKGIIKYITEENGLSSNIVYGLELDNQNRLWTSTASGLSCINMKSFHIQNYTKSDDLNVSQFNTGAYYKTKQGNIIFGGTTGFIMFNPTEIKQQQYTPKIVFTDFRIGNQSVKPGIANSPLQTQIDYTKEIKLKHTQNSISFGFVNTSPQSAEKKTYSWKLEDFDKTWSNPSASTLANYTNLAPGSYTFKVRVLNNNALKTNLEREIKVYITSPFYRTWWAYLFYFAASIFIFIGSKFYIKTLLARKRDKDRLQFFINVAHDLRTPLALIKSPINSLQKVDMPLEDRKNLDIAERNTDRLMRLITQLLDFQKSDANKMVIKAGNYNIVEVLDEILKSFKPLFDEKNINLKYQPDGNEILMWFDKDKFEKIIYNVISNAIKYSKNEGNVNVTINHDGVYCHITVTDNGIGIPDKQQKQIFKRYYRADNAINLQETGSGIGLMLTKQLVELHKGHIEFSSNTNVGTTFKISFLLSNHFLKKEKIHEEPLQQLQLQDKKSRKGIQILIVEDNLELQAYLANELSKSYGVDVAENGKIALKLTKLHGYDLIVSDIMMPEMNGYQLCTTLKNQISTCHVPIILLTAIHDDEYKIEGYKVGADDYLQKPFNITHIKTRIDNLLQNREIIKNKFFNNFEKTNTEQEDDPNFAFITKATEIVTNNLQTPQFSIDTLCNELAISRSVLFRKLKVIADVAPQDFIKNIRLKIAAEMLMSKKYTISEIAFLTGFSDSKYFSTSFKKKFKQSPSDFLRESETKD